MHVITKVSLDIRCFPTHLFISPWSPPVLPVTRMRPWPRAFMSDRKAWMVWMVPRRLTSRMCLIESKDWTSSGPIKPTPALHTVNHRKSPSNTCRFLPLESNLNLSTGSYPECPLFSPQLCLLRPGWTAGQSRPFGVFPRCPCADLSRTLKDAPSWPGSSLWHRLNIMTHFFTVCEIKSQCLNCVNSLLNTQFFIGVSWPI